MGLTRAQLKERAVKKITDYMNAHAKKIDENLLYWDTYPICVKDICTLTAVIENGKLIFCDYDLNSRSYDHKFMHSVDDLEYKYIDDILLEMEYNDKHFGRNK